MKTNKKINRTKLGVFVIAVLIVASALPLCLASGGTEPAQGAGEPPCEGKYPEVPGVPDKAVQYNKTETTPVAEIEQVQAKEPALFRYRNMTMLMNCSKNCQVIFTADPEVTPKILGLSIDPNQTMTLTMHLYRSPLQGEMVMERTLNFYLGIEPNATLQLKAQIRLHINQTELNRDLKREVNATRLTWMYWNQNRLEWIPVDSHVDQNGYLVCNTDHFSTWTVAEIAATPNAPVLNWTAYIAIVLFAGIAATLTAAILIHRR